jgi:hypothetical protein
MLGSFPSDEVGKSYRMRNEFALFSRMGTRRVLPGSHVCKRHREPFLTPRPMPRFMALS